MVDDLLAHVLSQDNDFKNKSVCVGLSGGVDSVVLLHVLARLEQRLNLTSLQAIHVHHGLSADADAWLEFCQTYCVRLGVDFVARHVQVQSHGEGVEAAARTARYAVFDQQECEVLALAHHDDDQAETFWLAALRGGGMRSLAAMPRVRVWNEKCVLRPFLGVTRAQIVAYAKENALDFVRDASNADTRFLRNWLRHTLLPEIAFRLPENRTQILATVAALQDDLEMLNEVIAADWAQVHAKTGQFSCAVWRQLSSVRQRQLLLHFAKIHNLGVPRRASVQNFAQILTTKEYGEWALPRGKAVAFRGVLFAVQQDFAREWTWVRGIVSGSLKAAAQRAGLTWHNAQKLDNTSVGAIRVARKTDVLLLECGGHKNVFQLLQERGVPAFARGVWAVAVDEHDECVAVANVRSAPILRGAVLYSEVLRTFQMI